MPFAVLIAILSAAAPLVARGSEIWPGFAPCALCLWQRWPYWVAAAIALAAAFLPERFRRWALYGAALAVLVSAGLAGLHVGVEQGWWPSPLPSCQAQDAGSAVTVEDLLRSLPSTVSKPCDAPSYVVEGVPVTIPQLNLLYALGLAGLILWGTRPGGAARRR